MVVHRSSSIVGAVMTLLAMMSSDSIYPHLHFGNELQQFERYEFLTRDAILSQERDFFKTIDECERSIVPEKGHRSYLCRYELRDKRQSIRQPLWSRQVDHKSKGMFKVDCKYSLHLEHIKHSSKSHDSSDGNMKYVPSSIEGSSLVFVISQSHCASKYDHVAKGGSNFEIFVQSSNHLASCNVLDSFNGSYKAYCPLPDLSPLLPSLSDNNNNRSVFLCSNITVTLHYEHFDAFCDIGHSQFSSLHHVLYRGPACTKQSFHTTKQQTMGQQTSRPINGSSSRYQHIRLASDLQGSLPIWTRRPQELITPSHKAILGTSVVYEWRGVEKKYLKVSRMKRCLQRQTLWFIGESHMRYQFDITMDRYVDKLQMGRYHGSVNVSGVSYSDNTFSHRMIAFLDGLPCPIDDDASSSSSSSVSQQPQTLVLQTGSWDLQFFPPRGYIRNPQQGQGVMEAIKRLRDRPHCSKVYRIIWMSIMPHPYCIATHEHCIRLMNYWRNNAVIRAANQFIERQLDSINYPGLLVLDTPSLALPRFPLHEIVCVDHFLCNDQPRGFITTPTGIAMGNEVLTASCAEEMKGSNDDDESTFRDGDLVKIQSRFSTRYFSVEGGCRREIPNDVTMGFMGVDPAHFTVVTVEHIMDIPVCFREFFLNRENGIMYQTYSDKTVFYLDSGYRRPMHSIQTLIQLERDLDEVKFVLEKDLESIPLGSVLMGKSDCNWCKDH